MSKTLLGTAVGVLLVVILIQTISLWRAPPPSATHGADIERADPDRADPEIIAKRLEQFGPVGEVSFDRRTGLFQAAIGGEIVYTTADGKYLLAGDIYEIESKENVTEGARAEGRVDTMAQLNPETAITYAPDGETQASVWVFTDVNCAYCRKFHQRIQDYTAAGIKVRYLAFPRSGPDSENWRLMQSVWCADDSRQALTNAKSDVRVAVAGPVCEDSPVASHYEAGKAMGLRGTPMIVTSDGRELGGYLSPADLAARLGLDG